jgi:hypothetical protein
MARTCHEDVYPLGVSGISVVYRRCESCNFIFTNDFDTYSSADWIANIYNDKYTSIDPDYHSIRPALSRGLIESQFRKRETVGLDYGAGNGMMAESLRDRGWRYDTYDPFGNTNMVAARVGTYNLCSAFEVFEHVPNPVGALEEIVRMSSPDKIAIVIGTNTSDGMVSNKPPLSWWYAGPRNGHISLFSKEALKRLGARFGLAYNSFGSSTHYLTRHWSPAEITLMAFRGKARRVLFRRKNGKVDP